MSSYHTRMGVTFMEVLIALFVIAIIVGLSIPLYTHYLDQSRVKAASENLYQDLLRVRSQTLKQQADMRLIYVAGSTWCYGLTSASNCDCTSVGSCNLGQINSASFTGVSLAVTGASSPVVFSANRASVSGVTDFSFTNSAGTITVRLNTMGSPQICSNDVGGYPAC